MGYRARQDKVGALKVIFQAVAGNNGLPAWTGTCSYAGNRLRFDHPTIPFLQAW